MVGSVEGREEVVTHQLTAQTARALNRWCTCVCVRVYVCAHAQALMSQMNVGLRVVHMVKDRN